jgi:hypothetical protein
MGQTDEWAEGQQKVLIKEGFYFFYQHSDLHDCHNLGDFDR